MIIIYNYSNYNLLFTIIYNTLIIIIICIIIYNYYNVNYKLLIYLLLF